MKVAAIEEKPFLVQMIGPLFLIPALMLAGKGSCFNYDLLFVAAAGLFLSAKWQIRGCAYALALLALCVVCKHFWIHGHHLFQACLESSIAFSLLITALAFEDAAAVTEHSRLQTETKEQSIRYLEEDLAKQAQTSQAEIAALKEKLSVSAAAVEESQAELSALMVLNEVLRKSTAAAIEEQGKASKFLLQEQSRGGMLLEEIDSLQKELNRLGSESIAQQNAQLFQELNAARFKEAQTGLVNETLARMHAHETQRVKQLESMLASVQARVIETEEKERALQAVKAAEPNHLEEIRALSIRLDQSDHIEQLYRQLKVQFEHKNEMLHEVRKEFFHADAELQKVRKEMSEMRLLEDPLPADFRREFDAIEEESRALFEENSQLSDLISHLMATAEKKK